MPKHMRYTNSGIVCLANDLRETADALQGKRVDAGDRIGNINDEDQVTAMVTYYPKVPAWTWYSNSRLIIVGHGNPESTHIMGDGIQWDAKTLAGEVASWLDNSSIGRISLHMCYGGGNRGAAAGANYDAFDIHPNRSFAYQFASYCSLAKSVTARTDRTRIQTGVVTPTGEVTRRVVGRRDRGEARWKSPGDKVIFEPQGGTPNKPVNPKVDF